MALPYGFAKAKVVSLPVLKSSRHRSEIQYHLHFDLSVDGGDWDVAVNVGTNDSDDLLKYKLALDFRHSVLASLKAAAAGSHTLTGTLELPAIDFERSDFLDNTGRWRDSDVMDGSDGVEPAASLKRLLTRAMNTGADVYVFGRFYAQGNGVHDCHMNQGSRGEFVHKSGNDQNDHNDIWQDGAVVVDFGEPECALYVAAFDQQMVPTDELGNPGPDSRPIS